MLLAITVSDVLLTSVSKKVSYIVKESSTKVLRKFSLLFAVIVSDVPLTSVSKKVQRKFLKSL